MCPNVAQPSRDKRDKQQKTAGLIVLNKQHQQQQQQSSFSGNTTLMCASNSNSSKGAISKNTTKSTKKQQPNHNINNLTTSMGNIEIIEEDELAKQLKKLRKRLRKIEQLDEKVNAGELNPEPEQIEKLASKGDCIKQIEILEKRLAAIAQQELASASHEQVK